MTNQTEQGAALPDKPNYHPWPQLSEFEPSGNSGEFTDAELDQLARQHAVPGHATMINHRSFARAVLAAAKFTPEGYTSDGWIDVDKGLPEPQTPVLLDVGNKYPLRVMWVEPKTLELGIDQDESAGEYDEETDTYYCHSGWYEWNQHDEVNWRVTAKPLRWMPLPATPGDSHAT